MKLIKDNPDSDQMAHWNRRLQDMLGGIELLIHEAAAAEVKAKQKAGGVLIEVPLGQFKLKTDAPSVAE